MPPSSQPANLHTASQTERNSAGRVSPDHPECVVGPVLVRQRPRAGHSVQLLLRVRLMEQEAVGELARLTSLPELQKENLQVN